MFRLALLFLVSALAAGFCGFGLVLPDLSLATARLLFFVFLMLAALTSMIGLLDQGLLGEDWLGRR